MRHGGFLRVPETDRPLPLSLADAGVGALPASLKVMWTTMAQADANSPRADPLEEAIETLKVRGQGGDDRGGPGGAGGAETSEVS
jgi:hypothetical protein